MKNPLHSLLLFVRSGQIHLDPSVIAAAESLSLSFQGLDLSKKGVSASDGFSFNQVFRTLRLSLLVFLKLLILSPRAIVCAAMDGFMENPFKAIFNAAWNILQAPLTFANILLNPLWQFADSSQAAVTVHWIQGRVVSFGGPIGSFLEAIGDVGMPFGSRFIYVNLKQWDQKGPWKRKVGIFDYTNDQTLIHELIHCRQFEESFAVDYALGMIWDAKAVIYITNRYEKEAILGAELYGKALKQK